MADKSISLPSFNSCLFFTIDSDTFAASSSCIPSLSLLLNTTLFIFAVVPPATFFILARRLELAISLLSSPISLVDLSLLYSAKTSPSLGLAVLFLIAFASSLSFTDLKNATSVTLFFFIKLFIIEDGARISGATATALVGNPEYFLANNCDCLNVI